MSHSILIAILVASQILSQSLLPSLPNGHAGLTDEIKQTAYERNLNLDPASVGIKKDPSLIAPIISANSAIALDLNSGTVLYSKDAYQTLPIASITKLMTALLVLEDGRLDEMAQISEKAASLPGSKAWLYPGDYMKVEDLLKANLIHSANDASMVLAEFVAGSEEAFVEKMNRKVLELKLAGTHFENPVGYDNNENYSTAYELTLLAKKLWEYPLFRQIVGTRSETIYSEGGSAYKLESTNDLLKSYLKVYGMKTGTTDAAGQALVAIGEVDGGRQILTVVLNSPDRYHETKVIFDWTERAYEFD
ncbi:MAG: D-alanyl-D-alanine carboxypeptidase [Candidatus Gracilibacteria bacterium]|nr:D-alanyl-D-alanine carboxypeptidase [Candidatus Gracilibacteria bacterium]